MNIPKFNVGDIVSHIASPKTTGVITKLVQVGEQVIASITHQHTDEDGNPTVTTEATHPVETLTLVPLAAPEAEVAAPVAMAEVAVTPAAPVETLADPPAPVPVIDPKPKRKVATA